MIGLADPNEGEERVLIHPEKEANGCCAPLCGQRLCSRARLRAGGSGPPSPRLGFAGGEREGASGPSRGGHGLAKCAPQALPPRGEEIAGDKIKRKGSRNTTTNTGPDR